MKPTSVAKASSLNPQRDKAVDNGGLRYGAYRKRASPAVPTATQPSVTIQPFVFAETRLEARLTNLAGRNIITPIRGSTHKVADIKSEPGWLQIGIGGRLPVGMCGRLRRNA